MPVEQHAIHIPETKKTPEKSGKQGHVALGVALVLLGILFLVKQVGLVDITWSLILMVIGGSILAEAWLFRTMARVFPGVFLILLGLIFLADNSGWISGGVTRNWPLVILALSAALIISPLVARDRTRSWSPGLILLAAGSFLLVVEYNWIKWSLLNNVLHWWPTILLLAGAWFLFQNTAPVKRFLGAGKE